MLKEKEKYNEKSLKEAISEKEAKLKQSIQAHEDAKVKIEMEKSLRHELE
jgi:hypothetical protein